MNLVAIKSSFLMFTFESDSREEVDGTIERVDGRVERFSSDGTKGAVYDLDGKRGTNSKEVFL